MPNFFYCTISLIVALSIILCKEKHSVKHKQRNVGQIDTIELLTDNQVKFWDVVKNKKYTYNHTGEFLNWMFSSNMQLVEYTYQKQKRIRHIYGGDIIVGYLNFELKNDTLNIREPFEEKYLIKKINSDTLIVQHLSEFGLKPPLLFKKAQNQTELPQY